MEKTLVCVLFGGVSPEHEVSCASARSLLDIIDRSRFDVLPVGITKDGRWLLTSCETEEIENGAWVNHPASVPVVFSPSRGEEAGIWTGSKWIRPDCVFPVLHGENGEDGSMQGLFRLANIPFVGSSVTSSAICMDKAFTKMLCERAEIAQAEWLLVYKKEIEEDMAAVVCQVEDQFVYPVFVKPANTGSSVGVSKAYDRRQLEEALSHAAQFDRKVLVEEFVDGLELEVGVLGNDEPIASGVGQILPSRDFYSYESKYIDGTSGLSFDPPISEAKKEEVRNTALAVFRLLDCRGLSRVDFFFRKKDERVIFNEINTLPGFTKISMYPKLFDKAGVPYSELITKLILLGKEA
ncbi:MAG TPA: D-alanine--D-alanine ligase [Clostridiales bacterium]|jgi:D-alanine-D-alanine ligase|nr:D-alanine--D-alanine ligase [Clostridiales bacterium]